MTSHSLLPSRDEVFKEIKDVGEDAAITSLHLCQGDMDLPPLYFHACLEEQVREEKLPPHHACDHHIKLEGLLPPEALSKFQLLKAAFTTNPILSHFNPYLPAIVETEASDYALGAVQSQVNGSEKPAISFDSGKLLPAELNYEIHDREILGIVWALKHWRAFLLSLSHSFEFLTDHSSLK
ncbi:hypothetical protein O181_007765 [Austropuccinia psidii MF-1]|uniref:Reverse transcriptase/retrotransposon-derived protein RNase H-like domain-containing protein n=1 Tax=Austropuccinia psidii MF-1 TaxID=1389203 RepID=A0A9Q3BN24_9BASI|nr:hypothetical protein [Austropuccinia psidii MF-1]